MTKNIQHRFGFIPPVVVSEDYWLGSGLLGSQVINPDGNWVKFLPIMEQQKIEIDVNACVSFAILNACEILYKFQYGNEPNYSDRFLAKKSGTSPENGGNSPKIVADVLRHSGTVPEVEWPHDNSSLEEYYKEIPQRLIDMGIDWLKFCEIGYEWADISKLKEALRRSPVAVAVSAWQMNDKGEYIRFGASNHYVVLVAFDEQDRPVIFDSYDTGLKILEKDFMLEFAQIYTLKKKEKKEVGFWRKIIKFINKFFE